MTEQSANSVELILYLEHEGDSAIRVNDAGKKAVWLPKSRIEFQPDQPKLGMVTVTLPEWLAKDRRLI